MYKLLITLLIFAFAGTSPVFADLDKEPEKVEVGISDSEVVDVSDIVILNDVDVGNLKLIDEQSEKAQNIKSVCIIPLKEADKYYALYGLRRNWGNYKDKILLYNKNSTHLTYRLRPWVERSWLEYQSKRRSFV